MRRAVLLILAQAHALRLARPPALKPKRLAKAATLTTAALAGGAVFVMEATAHHQDLRKPVPGDPAELVDVRAKEEALIRGWIAAHDARAQRRADERR